MLFGVALTGTAASVGLGAAIVRRLRELVVLLLGFAIGATMSVSPRAKIPVRMPDS